MFVDTNEQFERNRAVYELYLLCISQKSKNISFYMPQYAAYRMKPHLPIPSKSKTLQTQRRRTGCVIFRSLVFSEMEP